MILAVLVLLVDEFQTVGTAVLRTLLDNCTLISNLLQVLRVWLVYAQAAFDCLSFGYVEIHVILLLCNRCVIEALCCNRLYYYFAIYSHRNSNRSLGHLGVIIDRRLTFKSHIASVVKFCNYHLWVLQHICHPLPFSTAQTLTCILILSRLDYCNVVLYSCSSHAINWLQRLQNYAVLVMVRLVYAITATITVVTLVAGTAATDLQDHTNHL